MLRRGTGPGPGNPYPDVTPLRMITSTDSPYSGSWSASTPWAGGDVAIVCGGQFRFEHLEHARALLARHARRYRL